MLRWIALPAVGLSAFVVHDALAHGEPSPIERLEVGQHPRLPDSVLRVESSSDAGLIVVEPSPCDGICTAQRRLLESAWARTKILARVPAEGPLSRWLGEDEPLVLAVTVEGRITAAVPRAVDSPQLRQLVASARSHPTGVPLAWPR